MTLESAITDFVNASAHMIDILETHECDIQVLMRASDKKRHTRERLVRRIHAISANHHIGIEARTRSGNRILLTPSTRCASRWQTTRFDHHGTPWCDSEYSTFESALDQYLRECDIKTLEIRANPKA